MDWPRQIQQFYMSAQPYLEKRGDLLHTQVAHQFAQTLMKQEGGNHKIIEPAIILHDVGWSFLESEQIKAAYGVRSHGKKASRLNRLHEHEGAKIARHILESLNYNPQFTNEIVAIIQQHDSRVTAVKLEEQIVKDADKLWRFSKHGFWEEVKRQCLEPIELYNFLSKKYLGWFFTSSALKIAKNELKSRASDTMDSTKN